MSDEFDAIGDVSKWRLDPLVDACEDGSFVGGNVGARVKRIEGYWEPQSEDEFFCIFCLTKFTCGPERVIATASVDGVDFPACLPCAVARGLA